MARSKTPSPTALMREMALVDQIKMFLGEAADAQLLIDTIEGETQALEYLDLVIECFNGDKKNADDAYARGQRFAKRVERSRILAQQIMEKIGSAKIERSGYTASLGAGPPSVKITDEARIPRQYMAPEKNAIKKALKAGEAVPGATLNNAPTILRITTL